MLSTIHEFITAFVPFMVAAHDSGYNHFVNQYAMRDYLESFLIAKGKM